MLDIVIDAREAAISKSIKVKRILPFRQRRMVGPFIFMDHAGPITDIPSSRFHIGCITTSAYRAFNR
jgi:redox-sensitive bicupin YhaK (pirin superfamily)